MPEEVKVFFEEKYAELKGKAETYGDLEKLIKRAVSEENYVDPKWGILLRTQLMAMLHEEWGSLSVVR